MLEKFLVLLERFVVAHELIAANSAKQVVQVATPLEVETVSYTKEAVAECAEEATKEIPVEGEDVVDTKPAEEEEKPKRKPRKLKSRNLRQSRKKRKKKSITSLCVTRFRPSTMQLMKVLAMPRAMILMNCWKSSQVRR